jgi:ATP adenylyltransferase
MDPALRLTPANLWTAAQRTTTQALATGALQPIETEFTQLDAGGVTFLVRILVNIARKEAAAARSAPSEPPPNPFLPYDTDLWVGHLSDTHACLLNKFNVVDNHLLMVTRTYESQDSWLTAADFQALALGLQAIDGLGFYNGGHAAGASQHHKHLQLVPLPLAPIGGDRLPIDPVLATLLPPAMGAVPHPLSVPFQAQALPLERSWVDDPVETLADHLLAGYRRLMAAIGLTLDAPQPDRPYNLLVTRQWMMAVPRQRDRYQGIPINALGYAGSLLVKDTATLKRLQDLGPLNLLTQVGYPAAV